MLRLGRHSRYEDPFDPEGRTIIDMAASMVFNARTEMDRVEAAKELARVLEYVRQNHLRVNEDVHSRTGSELLLPSVESNQPLQQDARIRDPSGSGVSSDGTRPEELGC
jgi:hypothetical protein